MIQHIFALGRIAQNLTVKEKPVSGYRVTSLANSGRPRRLRDHTPHVGVHREYTLRPCQCQIIMMFSESQTELERRKFKDGQQQPAKFSANCFLSSQAYFLPLGKFLWLRLQALYPGSSTGVALESITFSLIEHSLERHILIMRIYE